MAILEVHEPETVPSLLFGEFELRLDSGELLRSGAAVKLQLQPARVLALLASRAGAVVSREEIRREVWGEEHVDFDLALNYAVRQVRRALDDSTEDPRYIGTVPRVGYRFLAPVEVRPREADVAPPSVSLSVLPEPAPVFEAPAAASPAVPAPPVSRPVRLWRPVVAALLAVLAVVSLVALRSRVRGRDAAAETAQASRVPAEAMRAFLEGQYFFSQADDGKARAAFERATALAPDYAPAWAELGHVLLEDEVPARLHEPLVLAAERRALDLDPDLALAHVNRAARLARYHYDWTGAERELREALDLDPQRPETHYEYAKLLAGLGRHDEALEQMRQALWLKPEQQLVRTRHPWFYYLARRYDEAVAEARRQIALAPGLTSETNPTQPELFWAFRTIVLASLAKGDRATAFEGARAEARWLGVEEPTSLEDFWKDKEELFAKMGSVRPWYRVVPAIELGQRDRALDLLAQQCRDRSDSMTAFLRVDPVYDVLRGDPRFQELLRCANLAGR